MPAATATALVSSGATDPGPGARSTPPFRRCAAALAARGVVKGDRVLVHSKNCDEMFWSMFAAFRLGAVWVPTNFRLMPDEVAYLATASGAKAFLCHGDFPDHATAAANPALEFTWRIGEGASARSP
jgi:fatty-acyl-CoA synthase